MKRWVYLGAPVGLVLAAGAWWLADQAISTPVPQLGPAILVTPTVIDPPSPSPTPSETDGASTVPPQPPEDAGDDDDDEYDD